MKFLCVVSVNILLFGMFENLWMILLLIKKKKFEVGLMFKDDIKKILFLKFKIRLLFEVII